MLAIAELPRSPSQTTFAVLAGAKTLQVDMMRSCPIETLRLRVAMEQTFGGSDADGAWDWKLADEALEVVTILFLKKFYPTRHHHRLTPCSDAPPVSEDDRLTKERWLNGHLIEPSHVLVRVDMD